MHGLAKTAVAMLAISLAACASKAPRPASPPLPTKVVPAVNRAEAALSAASGSLVSGRLVLLPAVHGVRITGTLGGLSAGGSFGFHLHENGDCSAVDASSAGGHFNPGKAPHGRAGKGPHHLGDMDNLMADASGVVQVDRIIQGATLGGAETSNILGRALIVHAAADDYRSQPAGNAGARLACGVITTDKAPAP